MALSRPGMGGRLIGWTLPLMAEAAAMGRSMVIAWVAGPEELGRAMMLALTFRLVEMLSDVGFDRLMSQSPDANAPRFLAAVHGAVVLRSLSMAVALLGLALPLALLFQDGPTAMAYGALALIALVRAGQNLDHRRAERSFRFGPTAVVEAGGTLAGLLIAIVLAVALGDYRAIIGAFAAQVIVTVVLSHLVAERAYRIVFDGEFLADLGRFGFPLMLNALLLFAVFQADRLIVAGWFGWAEVAIYGVALQLAMLPAQIAGRAAAVLLTPALRVARDSGQIDERMDSALRAHTLGGVGFALIYGLFAPSVIGLLFGAAMRPDPALSAAFGIAAGARILRTPLSQAAVVLGRTGDPARANLWRAAALVPATIAAAAGLPFVAIAVAAAIGEVVATMRALFLYRGHRAATAIAA